jgi:hypothetical protein
MKGAETTLHGRWRWLREQGRRHLGNIKQHSYSIMAYKTIGLMVWFDEQALF